MPLCSFYLSSIEPVVDRCTERFHESLNCRQGPKRLARVAVHWTTPAAGLLLTVTGVARAQAPGEATFDVEYVAPPECPDEGVFVAAITARAPSARRVEAGGEVHFHAEVAVDGPSTLSVSLPQGSSRREIPAAS